MLSPTGELKTKARMWLLKPIYTPLPPPLLPQSADLFMPSIRRRRHHRFLSSVARLRWSSSKMCSLNAVALHLHLVHRQYHPIQGLLGQDHIFRLHLAMAGHRHRHQPGGRHPTHPKTGRFHPNKIADTHNPTPLPARLSSHHLSIPILLQPNLDRFKQARPLHTHHLHHQCLGVSPFIELEVPSVLHRPHFLQSLLLPPHFPQTHLPLQAGPAR